MISIIVAMDEKNLIGRENDLPWHLPADLKRFRDITLNHTVIMGRKTFQSILKKLGKPLPKRKNIILSRDPSKLNIIFPNCQLFSSFDEALKSFEEEEEIFVIGGREVFAEALPLAQRIYLTVIHHRFEGDVYFPSLTLCQFIVKEIKLFHPDSQNIYGYHFIVLERGCEK